MGSSPLSRTSSVRLPCQVCGRFLTVRRDGLTKPHKAHRSHEPYSYCRGTGYRHARWEVGQKLRHHTGAIWEVVEDRGGQWGDYLIRCVSLTWLANRHEKVGREMVTHGEYMHRHGWELAGRRPRTPADVTFLHLGDRYYDVFAAEDGRLLGSVQSDGPRHWVARDRRSAVARAASTRREAVGLWGVAV